MELDWGIVLSAAGLAATIYFGWRWMGRKTTNIAKDSERVRQSGAENTKTRNMAKNSKDVDQSG